MPPLGARAGGRSQAGDGEVTALLLVIVGLVVLTIIVPKRPNRHSPMYVEHLLRGVEERAAERARLREDDE